MPHDLFTIGHSNHNEDVFIKILKHHHIDIVVDVRSTPFSRHNPQFNYDPLRNMLSQYKIQYAFMGNELGARRKERECYKNNQVDFNYVPFLPLFQAGIDRILKGLNKFRIALMCSEKEPLDCHRTILISRNIKWQNITINHILGDGSLEPNQLTEKRLLDRLNIQPLLFDIKYDTKDLLEKAYDLRSHEIAYREHESTWL
ncbi:MAG: DUF488 domain-containing protein [Proteobacteria bacterium]|nr:DUF488 domain-containing protein [Pseudomonadota bacterium]MBU4381682.1 DUF488 domain-containing protein [Pseudomonadota bacterium]MCG2765636.1 DUF488 domain-containing protein [Desulfarculaceae bacterium]